MTMMGAVRRRSIAGITDDDRLVLQLIERGETWTREALVEATGLNDRAVRRCIEHLRALGFPVLSTSRSAGYWYARTAAEVKQFRETELHSRMRVIGSQNRVLYAVERNMAAIEARESERSAPQMRLAI